MKTRLIRWCSKSRDLHFPSMPVLAQRPILEEVWVCFVFSDDPQWVSPRSREEFEKSYLEWKVINAG